MTGKENDRPDASQDGRQNNLDERTITALRPCRTCGAPGKLPSAAFSTIIDDAARARGWSDEVLAANAGISPGYTWRMRRADKTIHRPSLSIALALIDALELTGRERLIVLESSQPGVGRDRDEAA